MAFKLKIAVFSATAVLLPVLSLAFYHAPVQRTIPEAKQDLQETRMEAKDARIETKNTMKDTRVEVRSNIAEKRNMLKTEVKEKHDSLKTEVMQKREALKMEMRDFPKEQLKERAEKIRVEIKEKRIEFHDTVKEKREAFKEEAKERINTLKEKVNEERAKKIEAFFGGMVRKFESAISRLRILADRIDSRLDKFEDEGKDVSVLRTALDNARNVTESAEDALDKAKEEFTAFASTENPKEHFEKVKSVVHDVAVKVRDAHKALVDVVSSIKGSSNNTQ